MKQDPKNARVHTKKSKQAVARSLKELGAGRSILVDKDEVAIAGNNTLAQAEALGIPFRVIETDGTELVVVKRTDLSRRDPRRKQLALLDNLIADMSTYDPVRLTEAHASLIRGGHTELIEFAGAGQHLLDDGGTEGLTDGDAVPEDVETRVKAGEIWQLGKHRVMCGDATSKKDVAAVLGGAAPFLMVTDPPYGVDYEPSWREEHDKFDRHSTGKFVNDDRADWSEAYLLFPGDVAYTWSAPGGHVIITGQSLQRAGFELRSQLIWRKQHFVFGRGAYHWQHEPCWYGVRKGRKAKWSGDRKQPTVWDIQNKNPMGGAVDDANTTHAAQKPLECMARPIRHHGKEGDDIYDPFLGAGTTLIAAEKLSRVCYGLEIDPHYCDVTLERWEQFTGLRAEKA